MGGTTGQLSTEKLPSKATSALAQPLAVCSSMAPPLRALQFTAWLLNFERDFFCNLKAVRLKLESLASSSFLMAVHIVPDTAEVSGCFKSPICVLIVSYTLDQLTGGGC